MSGNDQCPLFVWGLLAFLGLSLIISLIFNVSNWVEKQRQDKTYDYTDDDYFQRDDDYYPENTPIYGNLDNVLSGSGDESCYEQMKARPERVVREKEGQSSMQAQADAQMCYASLDHSFKGKCRKPKACFSDKDENEKLHTVDTSLPERNSAHSFREEENMEENIHDDPIRLFGLIHAKREQINLQDFDPA
ncbi:T-cell receptor-associated transmembrane adapter 1 [Monodelphis domestica]|uniref:T cell receptor associated transmembrane adaptor 1 n=1 Tax=Monodelphis domestica TaxID=13616 RepID=A0A5F8GGX7_MONDO|nr:T-cell receptor-associated transmembrane adapter 1 [Monodelphis domestica]